jgi:hypothetical protein
MQRTSETGYWQVASKTLVASCSKRSGGEAIERNDGYESFQQPASLLGISQW